VASSRILPFVRKYAIEVQNSLTRRREPYRGSNEVQTTACFSQRPSPLPRGGHPGTSKDQRSQEN
jgi:hypothetical protein